MMRKFYFFIFILFSGVLTKAQKTRVSLETELGKLAAIADLPKYVSNTTVHQFSSYDRTGNNDDGFSGKYSFIRKEKDSSLVIFEAKGKGVINRIWTPTPTDDILDFYFDGSTKPSYSIKFSDLFSGKVFPFVAPLTGNELGGFFCYLPISYRNGCKIVFRGKQLQFYQIQYRIYPNNANVETFSAQAALNAKPALEALKKSWENPRPIGTTPIHVSTVLMPGKSVTLADLNHSGRITGMRIGNAEAFRGLNKLVSIKMTWDDEAPAVYMPLADFFGYAYGRESMQSLLLGTAANVNYCYFPMPFENKAKIELIYHEDGEAKPIQVEADIFLNNEKYDPKTEGKFYSFWHADKVTEPGKPHLFLEGKGRGHYVGTLLQAQGLEPGMTLFFEGDDVMTVDGELRMHGTGSEDYFNGGWYALLDRWDTKMSLPLHGALDYSLTFARTGGYRLFIGDKVPFNKQILHTIEHGPENNNKRGDYTSVALYYADKMITQKQGEPVGDLVKVYIPDTMTVYPQLTKYSVLGAVKIDGDVLHSTTGGQVKLDLSELPKGHYKLYMDIVKSPDGATVSVWQRQKLAAEAFSFYSDKREDLKNVYVCDIDLDDFKNAITLHFKRDDRRSIVNLNRLILVKEKK
ncbi:glycoside hydrolase family 172 protein [Pedobacter deserti]|uniref:glycoside hydrolase family 172 protein n=1 Tax=Pedobacter deserti TaxID=2817382 RepID=UPI00210C1788|nr:glycoside hydrolase family 172 protein [Pedobacter sp. SYSU D00382]